MRYPYRAFDMIVANACPKTTFRTLAVIQSAVTCAMASAVSKAVGKNVNTVTAKVLMKPLAAIGSTASSVGAWACVQAISTTLASATGKTLSVNNVVVRACGGAEDVTVTTV